MSQRQSMALIGLQEFFWKLIRRGFGELGLSDVGILNYVSELMARFARTENLYRIKSLEHKSLETVADMLWEIIHTSGATTTETPPYRKRILRQHMGDYTLFMTGIFREYVVRQGILDYYLTEGRRSYRSVFEFAQALNEPHSGLFKALADQFEFLAGALDYTKRVYFRPEMHTDPHQDILRQLSVW